MIGFVEQVTILAIEDRVVHEVVRRRWLSFGDQVEERLLAVGEQCVVRLPLVADGGPRVGRQVLAARRPCAVGGIHPSGVGQGQELVVEAVVQAGCQLLFRETDRREQVGASDVTDEQGVAGEHAVRRVVVGVFPHDDADRLGGVAGRVADLEHDIAERDAFAVFELARLEFGLGDRGVGDLGAGGLGELEVTRQEVGMEVRLDDEFDRQARRSRITHVLVDVAAGVDDNRSAGGFIGDQVRGLREAVEVVLRELHWISSCVVFEMECTDIIPPGVSDCQPRAE